MAIFSEKLNSFMRNRTIRWQLMGTVQLSFFITVLVIFFMAELVSGIMQRTSDSYRTNAELDAYLTSLSSMEEAMETYIRYRTFEGIDRYYHYAAEAESAAEKLHRNPSSSEINHREYLIYQLSHSFFEYSGLAIAARRANNSRDASIYFSKSTETFSFLQNEIMNVDMLYFTMNAKNYNESRTRAASIIRKSILIIILALLSVSISFYFSIRQITKPLSEISSVALRLAEREFDMPLFNNTNHDEIGNICRAFDSMIISIREYVDTIWEKAIKENELREKEIEIRALYTEAHFKALQDQIKPHFLFNTLNTGAQLAMIEGADKTCYFLEQVADFLRYNIQHPGNEATIAEEIGMLDNYIYIMKVRFGERFQFIKQIDDSVLETKMPNMVLQPLVENCMKHGLKDVTENGIITISVTGKESSIDISISDNGCGFDPSVKERIISDAENGSNGIQLEDDDIEGGHISTGLVNVISRLQFYFKDKDVFSIQQNPDGAGTRFFISIKNV